MVVSSSKIELNFFCDIYIIILNSTQGMLRSSEHLEFFCC